MPPVTALSSLADLADLVLPQHCLGCARPGPGLCERCIADGEPVEVPVAGLRVAAARSYDAVVRDALLHYKERGRRPLARPLGGLLADAIAVAAAGATVVLAPSPSTRARSRSRGGDHVRRLAGEAANRLSGCAVASLLRLTRTPLDSAGLDVRRRADNLAGAMSARPPVGDSRAVLIVDDIVTSGATLREAARALRQAGWPVLGAAVVAATPRRRGCHEVPRRVPDWSGRPERGGLA
jgi:predicted amidophosphoribosyltransferase